ncbi:MAG TPA: response regulator [Trueperaceae bacterium]|nr:response regulator [Trueperaceae bacterium]
MSRTDSKTRVLVADDAEGQRLVLDMLLSVDGYEVITVADGREALDYLKDNTPDLAILDVQMPHLTGLEVCHRMKRIPRLKDVPVIILTAYRDDHIVTQARMAHADRIVYKPLEGKDFRATVREVLQGPSQGALS